MHCAKRARGPAAPPVPPASPPGSAAFGCACVARGSPVGTRARTHTPASVRAPAAARVSRRGAHSRYAYRHRSPGPPHHHWRNAYRHLEGDRARRTRRRVRWPRRPASCCRRSRREPALGTRMRPLQRTHTDRRTGGAHARTRSHTLAAAALTSSPSRDVSRAVSGARRRRRRRRDDRDSVLALPLRLLLRSLRESSSDDLLRRCDPCDRRQLPRRWCCRRPRARPLRLRLPLALPTLLVPV